MKLKSQHLLGGLIGAFAFVAGLLTVAVPINAGDFGKLHGHVLIGPTCPVVTYPPTEDCSDRPYAATLSITTLSGTEVMRVSSDRRGRFRTRLAEGRYIIKPYFPPPPPGEIYLLPSPSAPAQEFSIRPRRTTEVTIRFDSGIL